MKDAVSDLALKVLTIWYPESCETATVEGFKSRLGISNILSPIPTVNLRSRGSWTFKTWGLTCEVTRMSEYSTFNSRDLVVNTTPEVSGEVATNLGSGNRYPVLATSCLAPNALLRFVQRMMIVETLLVSEH